jgi:hypothetical protein
MIYIHLSAQVGRDLGSWSSEVGGPDLQIELPLHCTAPIELHPLELGACHPYTSMLGTCHPLEKHHIYLLIFPLS